MQGKKAMSFPINSEEDWLEEGEETKTASHDLGREEWTEEEEEQRICLETGGLIIVNSWKKDLFLHIMADNLYFSLSPLLLYPHHFSLPLSYRLTYQNSIKGEERKFSPSILCSDWAALSEILRNFINLRTENDGIRVFPVHNSFHKSVCELEVEKERGLPFPLLSSPRLP